MGTPGMIVNPLTGTTQEIDECQLMPGNLLQNCKCAVIFYVFTYDKMMHKPNSYQQVTKSLRQDESDVHN